MVRGPGERLGGRPGPQLEGGVGLGRVLESPDPVELDGVGAGAVEELEPATGVDGTELGGVSDHADGCAGVHGALGDGGQGGVSDHGGLVDEDDVSGLEVGPCLLGQPPLDRHGLDLQGLAECACGDR